MELHELGLSVHAFNAVCRAGLMNVMELHDWQRYRREDLQNWVGKKSLAEIDTAFAELEGKGMFEKAQEKNTVIVSENYTRAITLTRTIIANAQAAQQSLYEVCKGLKEMRDGKLYKELGYQNFADFCENEVGIHRNQAMKYASIAEIENAQLTGHFEKIGTEKLYLLAKLDEPTRNEVTETVDVESVTVKELKAQITALQSDKDKLESQNADLGQKLDSTKESLASKDRQFQAAMDAKQTEINELRSGGKRRTDMLIQKIGTLKAELETVKASSQEVAVEDTSRVEELEQQLAQARSELADANAKLADRPMVQEALPGDGGERRRGEYAAISNAVEHAMEDLMDFLEDNDHCSDFRYFANRAKEKLREYNSEINDMLAKEEPTCQ